MLSWSVRRRKNVLQFTTQVCANFPTNSPTHTGISVQLLNKPTPE